MGCPQQTALWQVHQRVMALGRTWHWAFFSAVVQIGAGLGVVKLEIWADVL